MAFVLVAIAASAQKLENGKDSTTFKGYLYNAQYDVYIRMDFYHNNVTVPYQEIYGPMPGFFGDKQDGRKWLFTDATIKDAKTAEIQIINDYGSEDLEAKLIYNPHDGSYTLERTGGSTMKIVVNRQWVKIPKKLVFKKNNK